VGRVYRYGQDKIVHIYNLKNKDTIEETVRSYFDQRLRYAAEALSKVTGEAVEDLLGSLNGQLEAEIEPEQIYKRAFVEGTLNKQSKDEIKDAVQRAQRAYVIATTSLFRDCSSYSFDSYQKNLASPVTLQDLEEFTLKFLGRERRQVQRKDGTIEFLTPDILQKLGLRERYRGVTFDRAEAIRDSQAEFFAIGHPFVDAMLRYAGDYEFGGHTALRVIEAAGFDEPVAALQFNFIVRSRVQRGDSIEYLFDLYTVAVRCDGSIDEKIAELAASAYSAETNSSSIGRLFRRLDCLDLDRAYGLARTHLERRIQLWDWDEDVDLAGVAKLVVTPNASR
jgi:hypothetical protein